MLTDEQWTAIQKDRGHSNVRQPDESEREAATKRLKKIVGRSATDPGWQQRIRVRNDTGALCLAVVECFPLRGAASESEAWRDPSALMAPLVSYPLEDGAAVLLRNSPEDIVAARKKCLAAHEESERARFDAAVAVLTQMSGGSREAQEAAARERERWNPGGWANLAPTVRLALLLAYAVEARDAALSADLKAAAKVLHADGRAGTPSREWWVDLGLRL